MPFHERIIKNPLNVHISPLDRLYPCRPARRRDHGDPCEAQPRRRAPTRRQATGSRERGPAPSSQPGRRQARQRGGTLRGGLLGLQLILCRPALGHGGNELAGSALERCSEPRLAIASPAAATSLTAAPWALCNVPPHPRPGPLTSAAL